MMPGPGISVMAQPCAEVLVRLGKAEYITVRRPAGQKKKRDAEHGECGTFTANPKNQKSGRDVREAGWTSLFQAVAEPFSGARQQGVKADPEAVLSFHAVFACISLISRISPKCGCVLCRRMRMGYAGKRAGGILPASVVVPTPSRTASSF